MSFPYELQTPIGRGATSTVWRARSTAFDIPVAVKILSPNSALDPLSEVRAAARLVHPNIALLVDYGRVPVGPDYPPGGHYLVMEFAHAGSLEGVRGDWAFVLQVGTDLLRGLAWAHASGLVHRDIKPANLLADDPRDTRRGVRVADFGLSLFASEAREDCRVMGTQGFMAPEQGEGRIRDIGPFSDVFSAGKTLLDLLEPSARVPRAFPRWLEWMLARDPHDRFQTAADALDALLALGPPTELRPDEAVLTNLASTDTFSFDAPVAVLASEAATPAPRTSGVAGTEGGPPTDRLAQLQVSGCPQLLPLRNLPPLGRRASADALLRLASNTPFRTSLSGHHAATERVARWVAQCLSASGAALVIDALDDELRAALLHAVGPGDLSQRIDALLPSAPSNVRTSAVRWLSGATETGPAVAVLRGLAVSRRLVALVRPPLAHLLDDAGIDGLVLTTANAAHDLPVTAPATCASDLQALGCSARTTHVLLTVSRGIPERAERHLLHLAASSRLQPSPRGLVLAGPPPTAADATALPALSVEASHALALLAVAQPVPDPLLLRALPWNNVVNELEAQGLVHRHQGRWSMVNPDQRAGLLPAAEPALDHWLAHWPNATLAQRIQWSLAVGRADRALEWTLALLDVQALSVAHNLELARAVNTQIASDQLSLRIHVIEQYQHGSPGPDEFAHWRAAAGQDLGWVLTQIGQFHFRAGRPQQAIRCCEQALQLDLAPDARAKARTTLGWCILRTRRSEDEGIAEALASFETVLKGPPSSSQPRAGAGAAACHMQRGDREAAERLLHRLIEAADADGNLQEASRCRSNLADLLRRHGRPLEALNLIEQAIPGYQATGNPGLVPHLVLGMVLLDLDRSAEATHRLAPALASARSLNARLQVARFIGIRLPGKVLTEDEPAVLPDLEELRELHDDGFVLEPVVVAHLKAVADTCRSKGWRKTVEVVVNLLDG